MEVRELQQTVHNLEIDLDHMHLLFSHLTVPTILYDKTDHIAWCNKTALNLYWGMGLSKPTYRHKRDYFGHNIHDVMPEKLAQYIEKQNAIVRASNKSQYETWQDDTMEGTKEWQVLRFPCGEYHIGVVLFPKQEAHLLQCDLANNLTESS